MPKNFIDKLVFWIGLEGLWCYPASVLGAFLEGQSSRAIYSSHYFSVIIFLVLTIISFFIIFRRQSIFENKKYLFVLIPFILSLFLNFYQLDKPDLNGDEYDLGYQAYNMVDGIFAGRKAYTLSFSAHPPLALDVSHIAMQLINNRGLESLEDWQYRFAPALLGSLTVGIFFFLILRLKNNLWLALICSLLLATNSYHVFLSRIFQRESFLTFYLIIFLYFLSQKRYFVASFFLGGAFLVKAVAVIFIPILFLDKKLNIKKLIPFTVLTLPIIFYNLAAYKLTGYMDIFFSRIFHTKTHPGATVSSFDVNQNYLNIVKTLFDQFGPVIFTLGLISFVYVLWRCRKEFISQVFILFTLLALIAFYLNGIRIYYLSFLAIPWSYFIAKTLNDFRKSGQILFLLILATNLFFIYNTFFNSKNLTSTKYTEQPPEVFLRNYSLTTRGFLEDRGWKKLTNNLALNYRIGDCLEFKQDLYPLQVRRYSGINDKIKEFYLGTDYYKKYNICEDGNLYNRKWEIKMDEYGVFL